MAPGTRKSEPRLKPSGAMPSRIPGRAVLVRRLVMACVDDEVR